MLSPNIVVTQMSVPRLKRELKMLKGFEPKSKAMLDRIRQIEAELRVRASFHY